MGRQLSCWWIVVWIVASSSAGATDVCGTVSGVWNSTGSPYHVTCDITLPADSSLEIEAGTVIEFMGPYRFDIYGDLQAIGIELDSIVFTTDTLTNPARWRGLRFRVGSDGSLLEFCRIEFGEAAGTDSSLRGGGIYIENASPMIQSSTVRYCHAGSHGGGIFVFQSGSLIDNCLIEHNIATTYGGGISLESASPTITRCEIRYNHSGSDGGGIRNLWSNAMIDHCVIHHNTSGRFGGGLLCRGNSVVTSSTISFNQATTNGSGVYLQTLSTAQLRNTIVSHSVGTGVYIDTLVGSTPVSYSDIHENTGADLAGFPPSGLGQVTAVNANGDTCDSYFNIFLNPEFADANSNDFHLTGDSPCIDAGDPTAPCDPDGTTADIGAYYHPQPYLAVSPAALQFGLIDFGLDSTLILTMANPSSFPVTVDSIGHLLSVFFVDTTGLGNQIEPETSFEIPVSFAPTFTGSYRDTLVIVTNVEGIDTVRVPMSAQADVALPPVDSLVISKGSLNGIKLDWAPVTRTISGFPVTDVDYIIYGATASDGEFQPFGFTADTTYLHPFILNTQSRYFYFVEPFISD